MKSNLLAIAVATALALPILPGRVSAQEVQKTPAVQDSTTAVQAVLDTAKKDIAKVDSAVVAVADTVAKKAEAAVVAAADTVKAEAEKAVVAAADTVKVEAEKTVAAAADSVATPAKQTAAEVAVAAESALASAQEAEKAAAKAAEKSSKKTKEKKSGKTEKAAKAEAAPAAQPSNVQASNAQASNDAAIIAAAAQLLAQSNANNANANQQAAAQPAQGGAVADDAAVAAAAAKAADLARAQEKEAAMKMEADNARLRAAEAEQHRRDLKKAEREGRRTVKGRSYKFFNHLGVGLVSGLDGAGVDVALPIYGHLQLRGGYSFVPKQLSVKKTFDLGTYEVNGTDRDFDNVSIQLKPDMATYKAFLDIYPTRWTAFHLTLGAYWGVKSPNYFDISADLRGVLQPDEYASVYVQVDDHDRPGEYARISTDSKGYAHVAVRSKQEIRPYVGIGFGRCANLKHRVSVNFELGVQYIKGMGIEVYDYDGVGQYLTSGMTDGKDTVDNPLTGKKMRVIDTLAEDFNLWPVMRFGINVRLF